MRYPSLLILLYSFAVTAQQRPNVVLFIADDVGWNDFGCYGNKAVSTPNIDKIAKSGIKFQNAFLTASSCSPSRISILNGRYPHNTGAPELHMPSLASLPNLAGELHNNGYHTVSAGKWHQGEAMKPSFDVIFSKNNGDGGEENWLKSLKERPKEKPFFMWYASLDAHRIWGENEFSGTNNPKDVQVPPFMANTAPTKMDFAQYHDEITRFDAYVGKVFQQLQRENLLQNTIIIIMADNGRPFPRCKTRLYDDGIKTPFIVSWKGQFEKGKETLSMISAIDIAPTLLELCGIDTPETFQGKSFQKVLRNPKEPFRNYAFAEHNWHDYEAYERMVRTKDYLYIYNGRAQFPQSTSGDNHRDSSFQELVKIWRKGDLTDIQMDNFKAPRNFEELYDLKEDFSQLNDVSQNENYAITLKELRLTLKEWQTQTDDSEPSKLTPSNHDWLKGYMYKQGTEPMKRGEIPGRSKEAHLNNHPGKF